MYSSFYILDHFLPDKAIDLVNEVASLLHLVQESKPDALEQLDWAAMMVQIELSSLCNESDPLNANWREVLKQALECADKEAAMFEEQWQAGMSYCLYFSKAFV